MLNQTLEKMLNESTYKIVLSAPQKKNDAQYQRMELEKLNDHFQVKKYTKTQVFHEKLTPEQLQAFVADKLATDFRNAHAWDAQHEHSLSITAKGKVLYNRTVLKKDAPKVRLTHDRVKTSLFPQNTFIEPLYDMGIYTKEGAIVTGMYDKFRQINRFVEIIDDAFKTYDRKELHILDFGCGKSYLTFILYYYLTQVRGYKVHMVGLDLKKDVIEKCNAAAKKYGYDTLHFEVGDIAQYRYEGPLDMVISLHACDTATDFALFNAISWNAKMIFSVPCCQHELNNQIRPESLQLLSRYGILKERFCAIATDAIRANLLEACGYRTQVVEFIDMEHTPKNIMLRAIRSGKRKPAALQEAETLMQEFHFEPTFYKMLKEHGML